MLCTYIHKYTFAFTLIQHTHTHTASICKHASSVWLAFFTAAYWRGSLDGGLPTKPIILPQEPDVGPEMGKWALWDICADILFRGRFPMKEFETSKGGQLSNQQCPRHLCPLHPVCTPLSMLVQTPSSGLVLGHFWLGELRAKGLGTWTRPSSDSFGQGHSDPKWPLW